MPSIRIPAAAVPALRGQVARFLRAHGVEEGLCRADTDLFFTPTISAFLLAALEYVREEHPWIGRKGAIVDAPAEVPAGTEEALTEALPGLALPLTVAACLDALQRALPFEIVEAPCGVRRSRPRVFVDIFFSIPDKLRDLPLTELEVRLLVTDEHWLSDPARRNEVFREIVRGNEDVDSFFEIDRETAHTLARFLCAGSKRQGAQEAYREQAEAFLVLFGPETRWFASHDFQGDEIEDPFAHGKSWSCYDAAGNGAWGTTLALVATDGVRAAYLDEVWDLSIE